MGGRTETKNQRRRIVGKNIAGVMMIAIAVKVILPMIMIAMTIVGEIGSGRNTGKAVKAASTITKRVHGVQILPIVTSAIKTTERSPQSTKRRRIRRKRSLEMATVIRLVIKINTD
jgi:hypothetical protein